MLKLNCSFLLKYAVIFICASEPVYEIKFEQFMLLLDQTQFERCTIGRCKSNEWASNVFFVLFKQTAVTYIVTPAKLQINLELLTSPLSRMTHSKS